MSASRPLADGTLAVADSTLTITASEDRKFANLEIATDGIGRRMIISVQELDAIIRRLADVRSTLDPPVPASSNDVPMPLLGRINAVVPAERINGKRILGIRHSGLGWMAFALEGSDSADLAGALINGLRSDRDAGAI